MARAECINEKWSGEKDPELTLGKVYDIIDYEKVSIYDHQISIIGDSGEKIKRVKWAFDIYL